MRKFYLAIITCLFFGLLASAAYAKPHQLTWTWPATDCDGVTLSSADFIESEIVYSFSPMPMPSDTDGPCAIVVDPDAPASATSVPVPLSNSSIILNLQPGQTYYARIRVSAYVDGNWSSWSNQAEFTVPRGRPNVIRLSDAGFLDRWEFYLVESSALKFSGG